MIDGESGWAGAAMGGAVAATTAAGAGGSGAGSEAGQPRHASAPWLSWAGYR